MPPGCNVHTTPGLISCQAVAVGHFKGGPFPRPAEGTAAAEIKDPSVENPEFKGPSF